MNRPLRITLLTVLAVALVAAGAVGGGLYAHEEPKKPKKFSEIAGGTACWTPESVLDRVVPRSHYADTWKRTTRLKDLRYQAGCGMTVDGKQVLRVSVEQDNIERKSDKFGTATGRGETKSIPGFEQGWSSQDIAIITVPCTKKTDDDDFTRLHVRAQAWGQNYPEQRGDMVRIAKQALKAHRHTACVMLPTLDATT